MSGRRPRRWIGWIVRLYPRSFRERWGAALACSSERLLLRERRQKGMGAAWLALRIGTDLLVGLIVERLRARRRVRSRSIRERGAIVFDGIAFDVRDALRTMRRAPLHALAVVLTLALGIGANALVFAVSYHVLLRPLPYRDSSRLALLWEKNPERGWKQAQVAPANFLDWRERATTLSASAGFGDWLATEILSAPGEPAGVRTMYVAGDLFGVLGVAPARGRSFGAEEFWQADASVAVISDRLWRERFGADPEIVGRRAVVDGDALTIIGVAPAGFVFYRPETELWRPFGWDPASRAKIWFRRAHLLRAVARVAPGRSIEQVGAELGAIAATLEREYPETNAHMGAGASSYERWLTGDVSRPLRLVFFAVGLVLLVACANVAHLQLARATSRELDSSVRSCLGASKCRLARRALVEQQILSGLGGLTGLFLAQLGLPALLALGGIDLPRLDEVRIGLSVLLFTVAVGALSALIAGLAPALQGGRADLERRLRTAGRGGVDRRHQRIRQALVATEVALAVVVVANALLVIRSFDRLAHVDSGIDPAGVVTAKIVVPSDRYEDRVEVSGLTQRLLERVRSLPGVTSAGMARGVPTTHDGWTSDFAIEGRDREKFGLNVTHRELTDGYFETVHVPLVSGRFFDASDDTGSPSVAIVNRTLAEQCFPDGDAVGHRIAFDRYPDESSIWHEIVGVVGDERQGALALPSQPEIFKPVGQEATWSFFLVVRSTSPEEEIIGGLRRSLAEVDPGIPLLAPRSMTTIFREALGRERFMLVLFGIFGGLAFVLAGLGVYAVAAHSVGARRREIGVRLALGADRNLVVRGYVVRGLAAIAAGLAAGVVGSLALARAMSSLLFGVEPSDPASLTAAPALLLVLALIASWWPAWRAARVEPAEVLRAE